MRGGTVRTAGWLAGRVLLVLFLLIGAAWLFGPRESVDTELAFREEDLPRDLDAYLARREARYSDIVPGTEARIHWAGTPGRKTDLAVVYLHGFSATSEEIRPLPDIVAQSLGANLYFTRLTGHGRGGPAMAEATARDWLEDTAEALAIGRRIGREVIVIGTSTGATLAAIAATDAGQIDLVKGMVLISPNFRIANPWAAILTMPFARYWGPLVAGDEVGFTPRNDDQARYWTTRYPARAAIPLGALVTYGRHLDYTGVTTPTLFILSDTDRVISPRAARQVADSWGAVVEVMDWDVPEGDDPSHHVLAGRILSPRGTEPLAQAILDWVAGL